jgi:asparagine synthase (glutamine-hydrolysing)
MCGIAAIVGGRGHQRWIPSLVAALGARGPDARAVVRTDWFALGFTRLAIVTIDAGQQPVASAGGEVTLAFNGELYNYAELSREARERGAVVTCEADLLLALFLADGPAFVDRLDGDYAIAVCDERTRSCHLFRDGFGVKPLYYAPLGDGTAWAAASEVGAFFRHPAFSTEWDAVALAERRVLGFAAWDRTNFEAIRQVPPGGSVTLRAGPDGRVQARVSEAPGPPAPDPQALDLERIDANCARLLERAVRRRIDHSERFPVLIALSGGIDSTIIACAAAAQRSAVAALTLAGAQGGADELSAADVAANLSLAHRTVRVTAADLRADFPRIVLALGAQGPAYSSYVLGAAMRRNWPGARVALCGEGADELFHGYWMHLDPASYAAGAAAQLAALAPALVERSPLLCRVAAWPALAPTALRAEVAALMRTHQLVNRHLIGFDHGLMAHGIECRVPFLDRAVARWLAAVPETARVHGRTPKVLLRLAVAEMLGAGTLRRRVLEREPLPLRAALANARRELVARLPARLGPNAEDAFWLGAVEVVFQRYRASVDGLEFADLEAEVLRAAS